MLLVMAAEATGRRAAAIELDPAYCDVIIKRWQEGAGKIARHDPSGLTLDELARDRGIEQALPRP